MLNFTNRKKAGILFVAICVLICSLSCWIGVFAPTYTTEEIADAATYDSYYAKLDESLSGTSFRSELASLITTTHKYNTSYAELIDVYPKSDADPNNSNNILWFYTGTSVKAPSNFNSGTNREHVWPKQAGDAFPEKSEAGSDAHHLRPCNANLNSTRSNNGFGEVPQTTGNIVGEAGSKSYDNLAYQAGGVFYPGEGYRGATARILMYVQTRWGDKYNLSFVLGQGHSKTIGDIEDLFKWHIEEPPTEEEIARNEAVYKIQGNRNPFIDHPEYAEMIYCHDGKDYNDELQDLVEIYGSYLDGGQTKDLESLSISPSSAMLTAGETTTLTVTATPTGASNEVTWTSSNTNIATVNDGVVTAISAGSAIITATSTQNKSVSATFSVTVKAVSAITLTGAPIKTTYTAGDTFNPTGLTVTATYSDGSTVILSNNQCKWLDATTNQETLSGGTTTVLMKYGNFVKTVQTAITVTQATTKTLTISRASFTGSGAYAWTNWTADSIEGYGFMYPGNNTQIQMNSNKTSYYIYNTTPLSNGIKSITIKASDGKNWEVRTSETPFEQVAGNPTTGTSRGTITSSSTGAILDLSTSDQYFAICYKSTGAAYIDEIIVTYGSGSSHTHTPGNWIVDNNPTCSTNGARHTECSECGDVVDVETLLPTDHNYGNWTETKAPECGVAGVETRTCTYCGNPETRPISALEHTYGQWTPSENDTETRTCSACGHADTRNASENENVVKFNAFVQAVQNASGLTEKYDKISVALKFYKTLSDNEKEYASDDYALLVSEINNYNTGAEDVNAQSHNATNDAIMLFAGSISVLAIAAYFLLKA